MMLPLLLLPLLISVYPSCSARNATTCSLAHMHELETNVETLGVSVKNLTRHCPENCSSGHITDRICKCFNLTVSQQGCAGKGCVDYFCKGLQSLDSIFHQTAVQKMLRDLPRLRQPCTAKMNIPLLPEKLSPQGLHKKLEELVHRMNASQ